jgi:hypothetical protein
MAHKIAVSNGNVAWLDQNGQPWIFSQNSSGQWQEAQLAMPLPTGVTGFTSIAGVAADNPLFIALAALEQVTGVLYYTDLTIPWSPISAPPYPQFSDFSAYWDSTIDAGPLFVAGTSGDVFGGGEYSITTLAGTPGLDAPSMQSSGAVISWGPELAPGTPKPNSTTITVRDSYPVVLFAYGSTLYGWINVAGDGVTWMPAPIPISPSSTGGGTVPIDSMLAVWSSPPANTPGSPSTLWALMLVTLADGSGIPWAMYNTSHFNENELIVTNQGLSDTVFGNAWQNYGTLPNQNPAVPLLSTLAAAVGLPGPSANSYGALQVVGIGLPPSPARGNVQDQYPYCLSLSGQGVWSAYNNEQLPGFFASRLPWGPISNQVSDLAMGLGSNNGVSGLLVAYIGLDGNIYADLQDTSGNWSWCGQIATPPPPPPGKRHGGHGPPRRKPQEDLL